MNAYWSLFLEAVVLVLLAILILSLTLLKFRNKQRLDMRGTALSSQELEALAKRSAIEHTVSQNQRYQNWPLPHMNKNYNYIFSVYKELNEDIQKDLAVPPAAEWLLDNFYVIEEEVNILRKDLEKAQYARLPILTTGSYKGYTRIFALIAELITHTDGLINDTILADYLKAYQSQNPLYDREIWAIPQMLTLAYVENICHLCENIQKTQQEWRKAKKFFDNWMLDTDQDNNSLVKLFQKNLKLLEQLSPTFIEHLFYLLRRSEYAYITVLQPIDESLAQMGTTLELVTQKEHSAQSINTVSMENNITGLHFFASFDWTDLFSSASQIEQILDLDPDSTYPAMDLSTRNYYRNRVEELALRYKVSEFHIAKIAIKLAQTAWSNFDHNLGLDPDALTKRSWHVGYYLIFHGLKDLEQNLEHTRSKRNSLYWMKSQHQRLFYLGSIGLITAIIVLIVIQYTVLTGTHRYGILLSILAGILVLIPASEIATNIVNRLVCKILKPVVFPQLSLKEGIPQSLSTIVVIPTLLSHLDQVKTLLTQMENHYLSNRENHLFFALIGAMKDANQEFLESDNIIIETTLAGIESLNQKYAKDNQDKFYFFNRGRHYNESNNKWISWERKRGALMEFNDLVLQNQMTGFTHCSNQCPPFEHVKYIITLDSDTRLPAQMAKKMIATMAHPLNVPIIDTQKGIVTEGYGIMQPRVDVDMESANQSLFSRIFAGQEGSDPYATAISDVYQDLFGEGIFTGKGIYDLAVFQTVLQSAFPDNTILSHDLLEGSYVRTGLATHLKLIDSYPSKYNAFSSRLYRWIRGDWQLLGALFPQIHNGQMDRIKNPISHLSRWKILDNLRRSLVAPSLALLGILGFILLPGDSLFWLTIVLTTIGLSFFIEFVKYLWSLIGNFSTTKRYNPVITGVKAVFLQSLLQFIFLPYQAALMLQGIGVTLYRLFITQKNLLVWVTSSDMERSHQNSLFSYITTMWSSYLGAALIIIPTILMSPNNIVMGLIIAFLWAMGPFVAYQISLDIKSKVYNISEQDRIELGRIARQTWRYFEDFSGTKNHYLPPDNYQSDPPKGLAYRTSPTNIGLGLMATLSARDLGYLSTYSVINALEKTITTMEGLPKWHGHLYNWYDTKTLHPLSPMYISTVDSGNLAAYLITLSQGLAGVYNQPLADGHYYSGLRDTLYCAGKEGISAYDKLIPEINANQGDFDLLVWNQFLDKLIHNDPFEEMPISLWKTKMERMIHQFKREIIDFTPGITLLSSLPEDLRASPIDQPITLIFQTLLEVIRQTPALINLPTYHQQIVTLSEQLIEEIEFSHLGKYLESLPWLYELRDMTKAALTSTMDLLDKLSNLMRRIDDLSQNMNFIPLYNPKKNLFSIGYNLDDNKLTNSYYDLLASEARQCSYICIARGDIPVSHWFRMGRPLTIVDGYKGLLSWTGTMFEYFMPLLLMKNYKNTLLDETYSFVIKSQQKYGRMKNMPWGVSESGFYAFDSHLDYQYKAIGVPWLGLKRGLVEDSVAAPYATFLALQIDPKSAIANIARLKKDGLDGPFGFYEAVDYTPDRQPLTAIRTIVKSYMAHHQGMTLMAIDNFLNHNIMQERFGQDAQMNAARLLLQEKVPSDLVITKESKDTILPIKQAVVKGSVSCRTFIEPNPILPKIHIISNGNYTLMITDRGTGYSKTKLESITRWREDQTLDPYGMFFYLRNVETNALWSATYAPILTMPQKYKVIFTAGKAHFIRQDGCMQTDTEIIVAPDDNTEIRRLTIKNKGNQTCIIEITSYLELVLTDQAADVAHPAFSNLFVECRIDSSRNCIISNRRPRGDEDKNSWSAHALVVHGKSLNQVQFETDRMAFVGRNHTAQNPETVNPAKPLSNTQGSVLDPINSIRTHVQIEPQKSAVLSYITTVSEHEDVLLARVDKYIQYDGVENAFQLSLTRNQVETNYLNLKAAEVELYQNMLSHLIFISPLRQAKQDLILPNKEGQSSLWRYGISGDIPLVLVVLDNTNTVGIVYEILKATEYWRLMELKVDLVLLSQEEAGYAQPLHALMLDIVSLRKIRNISKNYGNIFVLEKNNMEDKDAHLLFASARIILFGNGQTMAEQMNQMLPPIPTPFRIFPLGLPEYATPPMEKRDLEYFNGLGGFSKDDLEYIIQLTTGLQTPAPWINVIANPQFGFTASETGSGYTWFQNSRENKLTPWTNDAVCDQPGEIFYLMDDDTGAIWTITAAPIREEETYTVRHGFGYSIFEHQSQGIRQSLTQHVPLHESVKVSVIELENTTNQTRSLRLTYYVRPVLGVSEEMTAMHIKTRVGNPSGLYMENSFNEEFAQSICYMDCPNQPQTYTSDRKEFFGIGGLESPDSLHRENLSETTGTGFDPCGVIQIKLTLSPGEIKSTVFLLGSIQGDSSSILLEQTYTPAKAADSLLEVQAFWQDKINILQVDTPESSMNLMLNGWLQYQIIACRLWARSAFYQSGGALGFRDQLQDVLSLTPIWPEIAREQILIHAGHQFEQGDVQHWWHEPTSRGVRTRFSDDLIWLPYVTAEYIRMSGDEEILGQDIPLLQAPELNEFEDDRYDQSVLSVAGTSLYNHCILAINHALKFGQHGLPLMGSGDWNDGMNTVGNKGRGESVWLGWFLITVLDMMIPLCLNNGDNSLAENYQLVRDDLHLAIETSAWDGNWYRRAYFDDGQPLGSATNQECMIDSIAQTWSIISGAGQPERSRQAMTSLEEYLISYENKLIKLLTPPFNNGSSEPGYIKGYLPGVRENGGQYTHAAAWVIIAYALEGDGNKATELFKMINPISHTQNLWEVARYKVEPYVMAADVYTVYPHMGRGGWTWYTGSAGWMYQAGIMYILGFKLQGQCFTVEPCIPCDWSTYSLSYKYKETTYNIQVVNPQGVSQGVIEIIVDEQMTPDKWVELRNDGLVHEVRVIMG